MNVKILCTYEVSCYLSLFLGMTHVVLSIHCSIRLLFYLGNHQSPVPSYQGNYVCSDISHELIHHKIIQVPFRQPSTVFQPTGAAGEADHVEPGSIPSSLTCNRPTLASTRRGFVLSYGDGYAHRWACHLMMMMIVLSVCESVMQNRPIYFK